MGRPRIEFIVGEVKALIWRFIFRMHATGTEESLIIIYLLYLENAKEALVPPNPKLLDRDTLTSFC